MRLMLLPHFFVVAKEWGGGDREKVCQHLAVPPSGGGATLGVDGISQPCQRERMMDG